ncbi:MAG: O-antigen ligase family protein [Chloroflexi bacterium]|nr:O-antigen ligase family protein [Chloroflexota bacterium]
MIGLDFASPLGRAFGGVAGDLDQDRKLILAAVIVAIASGAGSALLPPLVAVALVAVVCFSFVFLVNTRLAVLALLAIRASADVFQDKSLFSVGGEFEVNVAAMFGFGIVLLGSYYIIVNKVSLLGNPISIAYAVFLIVGLVGLPFSTYPASVLADWLRAASIFVMFNLILHLFPTRADVSHVILTIGISSILPLLMGSYQFATGQGVLAEGFERVYGTFVVPPIFAFYLVLLLPLLLVLSANARTRFWRVALGLWLLVAIVNLVATYTRGAWIGAGLALTILAVLRFRKLLLALPIAALVIAIALPQVADRLSDLGRDRADVSYKEANTWVWRMKYWRDSVLTLESQNVLVGTGLGTISKVLYVPAHNDYLRLFVETGSLGLLSYLAALLALGTVALNGWRRVLSHRYRDIVLAFLTVFLAFVAMSFADNIVLNSVLQWYFWSLAAVMLVIVREDSLYERGG